MSTTTVIALAILTAGIAGLRSTWSPCSLSMLSMVTPSGEASRGHRYSLTATWFVAGAAVGGATLGAAIAALAAVVHQFAPEGRVVAVAVVTAAILTVGSDLRVGGLSLPRIPRQVDERWLNRYRGWVYGAGYGWQIGVGLSTYVMTAAVYLMIVLGSLSGRPVVGLLIGVGFGTCRGLALLLGARLRDPSAAHALHAWLEAAASWSLGLAVAGQVAVLGVGVGRLGAVIPAGIAAALVLAALAASQRWAARLTSARRRVESAH
ncbi:MAG TPA: hypothetical protein VHV79_01900 [Mycobacteriales bacterium]|nr:hypothetical protein [Mycobacteriales bacterium]